MPRKRGEMRIKIEPKEFFMYAVFLAFSKERPAPEDAAIKAYLDAHELIPKAQGTDRFEDQEFAHSTALRGRRGVSYVEGCPALDFPSIHDAWSQDQP